MGGPPDDRDRRRGHLRPDPVVSATDLIEDLRDRFQPRPLILLVVGLVAAGLGAWWLFRPQTVPPELTLPMARPAPSVTERPSTVAADVAIHVTGRVAAPGVYLLDPGSRVQDAVDAAGGAVEGADLQRVNLAAPVEDGMQIWVPGPDEDPPVIVGPSGPPTGASSQPTGDGESAPLVEVNRASAAELEVLPGVGPATAAAIIAHRDEHGSFATVDDLIDVRGIGPAKLEAIRPLVSV